MSLFNLRFFPDILKAQCHCRIAPKIGLALLLGVIPALVGCATTLSSESPQPQAQNSGLAPAPSPDSSTPSPSQSWRPATSAEQSRTWDYILNSPLGIAALNQLAIEGFISPVCPKTLYVNRQYGGFQTLLQVQCPDQRGASAAKGYREMRVTFNRFEDTIENFTIERVYADRSPTTNLPE